ncbi:hypothetical protein Slin15195_G107580 [Septoria linicola]|uniref:Uncharacterized protein n=1 Tax=Septoria linicola TaxID=215465 RepID=A0A9Q9AXX6_9PEZI|nr:hypothetical protein Slin15195_G107580 [Septoria linicola]
MVDMSRLLSEQKVVTCICTADVTTSRLLHESTATREEQSIKALKRVGNPGCLDPSSTVDAKDIGDDKGVRYHDGGTTSTVTETTIVTGQTSLSTITAIETERPSTTVTVTSVQAVDGGNTTITAPTPTYSAACTNDTLLSRVAGNSVGGLRSPNRIKFHNSPTPYVSLLFVLLIRSVSNTQSSFGLGFRVLDGDVSWSQRSLLLDQELAIFSLYYQYHLMASLPATRSRTGSRAEQQALTTTPGVTRVAPISVCKYPANSKDEAPARIEV